VTVRNALERAKYLEHPILRRLTGARLISMASARTFWFIRRPPQWKVLKLVSQITFVDQKVFLALAPS
jgi:hypothetical protein